MKDAAHAAFSDLLLEAAADPDKWNLVIEKLVELFNARKGGMEFDELGDGRCAIQADHGLGPVFREEYKRQFGPSNPFRGKRDLFTSGSVFTADQMISMAELRKTAFYRDFLLPHDIEYVLCAILFQDRNIYGFLNLARPKGMRPFGASEIDLMRKLLPRIQQALMVNRTIAQISAERSVTNRLLDNLTRGIVLLDASGKVLMVNRSALGILEARDGLMFEDNGIRAVLPGDNQKFKELLQEALNGDLTRNGVPHGILVARTSSPTPLSLVIAPLGRKFPFFEEPHSRVVIFISDPECLPKGAETMLRGLYGFTDAESRLAGCLLRGLSLEECSKHLGITLNTTRTHLKRLFLKSSTNRQGELIRVLMESPAMLHLDKP